MIFFALIKFLFQLDDDQEHVEPSPANLLGLPMRELCEQLRYQLEYYFSYKNLSKDQYLVSRMDDEQYVEISIVANFDKIKRLTNDLDLVVRVLRSSTEVTVDETGTKVKPNSKRRIVILRDVPDEINENLILKIFEEEKCPVKLEKCDFAHNQSYYLYFYTDEDAQKAVTYLRDDLINYPSTNIPILARIKAKPTVRHQSVNNNTTNNKSTPNVGTQLQHNVINPIGIVTAPSPVSSTVSSHSAAVSPVSSISGSVNNANTVLMPNQIQPESTATINTLSFPNAANVYSYNVPNNLRVSII